MKKIIAVLSITIFAASMFSGCIDSGGNENASDTGENFSFITIDGKHEQLSDYRGKVVVLDIMGVHCPPCQIEMFELKEVSKNYGHNDVAIISVDVYTGYPYYETVDTVQSLIDAFRQQAGIELDWTFSLDNDGAIGQKYIINNSVPSIYILDQEGKICFKHAGISAYDEIPPDWPQDVPKLKPIIDELLE